MTIPSRLIVLLLALGLVLLLPGFGLACPM